VPGANRQEVFTQMASLLLLTYALRNADCHAKNLALRYTSRRDVHLAPAFDMITTAAYPDYAKNPPAISFMGRKTWDPGKTIQTFITATFGVPPREQASIVERIGDAMSAGAPRLREAMHEHPAFEPIGTRMLYAWNEGLLGLINPRTYSLGSLGLGEALAGLSEPPAAKATRTIIGRSELLGE
jgi:serine/threonine-protein kinase HipA